MNKSVQFETSKPEFVKVLRKELIFISKKTTNQKTAIFPCISRSVFHAVIVFYSIYFIDYKCC